MKHLLPTLVSMILMSSLSGCSQYITKKSATEKRVDLIVGTMYKTPKDNEIAIDDQDIESVEFKENLVATTAESRQDMTLSAADDSTISTMYDGYGNKNEARCFDSDPLVKCIVLRTFANGQKQVFVFAQNGDIDLLPDNQATDLLAAPPAQVARMAGIFTGRRENPNMPTVQLASAPSTSSDVLPDRASNQEKVEIASKAKPETPNPEASNQTAAAPDISEANAGWKASQALQLRKLALSAKLN